MPVGEHAVLGTLVRVALARVGLGGGLDSTLTLNLQWPTERRSVVQLLLGVGLLAQAL